MTTETIFTLAKQMSEAFDGGKRDNGDSFRKLKDGSPEWMSDIVRESHNEMMPDDWRYAAIEQALDKIAECPDYYNGETEEARAEFADDCDVYNSALAAWLGSHAMRGSYVDDAVEELGQPDSIWKALQYGQYAERSEIWDLIVSELEKLAGDSEGGDE